MSMKNKGALICSFCAILSCFSYLAIGQSQIPENASPFIPGTGWVCNPGYKRIAASCVKFELPDNAVYNRSGTGWRCSRGYRRESEQCVRLQMPVNDVLDLTGYGWTVLTS